jgi:hypothetical protein
VCLEHGAIRRTTIRHDEALGRLRRRVQRSKQIWEGGLFIQGSG